MKIFDKNRSGPSETIDVFLPLPKHVERMAGAFICTEQAALYGPISCAWMLEEMAQYMMGKFQTKVNVFCVPDESGWCVRYVSGDSGSGIAIQSGELPDEGTEACDDGLRGGGLSSEGAEAEAGAEAYDLQVTPACIELQSLSFRGLMYSWFTVRQWIAAYAAEQSIPAVFIHDAPDLELRGMHFDLKGSVPHLAYIKETIRRLAEAKINTLLIEYENQFPYRIAPVLHKPGGLSRGEITEMLGCARQYGMQVIPVLQCLGHADYVLQHEDFAHLREDGLTSQYCPSHPATLEWFEAALAELLELHPDCEYVHIGADETLVLGSCEQCGQYVRNHSRMDLYLLYVGKAAQSVLRRGKKPIIWDDMFQLEGAIERISELPKGTAICSWSYYDTGRRSTWVWWRGKYYASKKWMDKDPGRIPQFHWIEELPEADQQIIRKYWDEGEYPEYGGSAVPWVKHYISEGYEVIGASCVRGADHINAWSAYPEERVRNAEFRASFAKKSGMQGVIASAWTRFYSLSPSIESWESGWFPALAHAAFCWNRPTDMARFERMWLHTFAENKGEVLQAIHWLNRGMESKKANYFYTANELLSKVKSDDERLNRYVQVLAISACWEAIALNWEAGLKEMEWMLYYRDSARLWAADFMARRSAKRLKEVAGEAKAWAVAAAALHETFMPAAETEELIGTKLAPFMERYHTLERAMAELFAAV